MRKLKNLQKDISRWSTDTFPHQTPLSKIAHIRKELDELEYEIKNRPIILTNAIIDGKLKEISIDVGTKQNDYRELMELADIEILFLSLCEMRGITPCKLRKAVLEKMKINKARKWGKPDADGVCHHI